MSEQAMDPRTHATTFRALSFRERRRRIVSHVMIYGTGVAAALSGLGTLQGHIFRIGHMGDLNEPMLLGALAAIELALAEAGIPHARGGVANDAIECPNATRPGTQPWRRQWPAWFPPQWRGRRRRPPRTCWTG